MWFKVLEGLEEMGCAVFSFEPFVLMFAAGRFVSKTMALDANKAIVSIGFAEYAADAAREKSATAFQGEAGMVGSTQWLIVISTQTYRKF